MTSFPTTLISSLSERYADAMCGGDPQRSFDRSCIAAAYIVGSMATRQRITNIIDAAVRCENGLHKGDALRLLRAIEHIESLQQS